MRPGWGILDSGTTILNPLILASSAARTGPGKRYAPSVSATPAIKETPTECFIHSLFLKRWFQVFEFQADRHSTPLWPPAEGHSGGLRRKYRPQLCRPFSPHLNALPPESRKWFKIRYSRLQPAVDTKGDCSYGHAKDRRVCAHR